jgi:hypothetical protein
VAWALRSSACRKAIRRAPFFHRKSYEPPRSGDGPLSLLVAQIERMTLMTADSQILAYDVETL